MLFLFLRHVPAELDSESELSIIYVIDSLLSSQKTSI